MERKSKYEEYTEAEYLALLEEIYAGKGGQTYQDDLVDHVCDLAEHPDHSDLLFYNANKHITPAGVLEQIKEWRAKNGKPGFKA